MLNADAKETKKSQPKATHSTPRKADTIEEKSTTLIGESLTSTIEREFHEENLDLSIPGELKQDQGCESYLERAFDHGNDGEGKDGFHRKHIREDDSDEERRNDLELKQDELDGTSFDDISNEPEKASIPFLNENEDWRGLTKKK